MTEEEPVLPPIEYTCQICHGRVLQYCDASGLPEKKTTCPWCTEQVAIATKRFREREARQARRKS